MKILAFAGSNSASSINKQLVTYVCSYFKNDEVYLADLNDYNLPIYSIDLENQQGIPSKAIEFSKHIASSDLIILSLAEHNGAYTAVFKNLLDWLSRIEGTSGFHKKNMFLLATSPGARGGIGVLNLALDRFPRNDANIIASYSLPSFQDHFNPSDGITNPVLKQQLQEIIQQINPS